MQGIFVCIGLLTGLLIFLLRGAVISIYSISPETRDLSLQFLLVLSITVIGSCYEYPVESGIIAGGGTTKEKTHDLFRDHEPFYLFFI